MYRRNGWDTHKHSYLNRRYVASCSVMDPPSTTPLPPHTHKHKEREGGGRRGREGGKEGGRGKERGRERENDYRNPCVCTETVFLPL